MSKKDSAAQQEDILKEEKAPDTDVPQAEVETEPQADAPQPEQDPLQVLLQQQEDKFLRLAAEYDNFRKRTTKEKEGIWAEAKADTALAFLPVYDNLERALKQDSSDEAYKRGVEMTMSQLKEVLAKLGIVEIPALNQPFDPNFHNAVMHVEDETLGEGVVCEVYQAGFTLGEKVIRFAMVKVAN